MQLRSATCLEADLPPADHVQGSRSRCNVCLYAAHALTSLVRQRQAGNALAIRCLLGVAMASVFASVCNTCSELFGPS